MKIIKPGFEIIYPATEAEIKRMYQIIEIAGRVCYQSEAQIADGSAEGFIRRLIERGHEAILEHASMTVKFTVDRGVSHEIVRHRIASYAQESTRYCNYSKNKFGNEITVIRPFFLEDSSTGAFNAWSRAMTDCENAYFDLLKRELTPQEARAVLPNSLKTDLVMTANLREWRHFFKLRAIGTTGKPHPQMAEVAIPLLKKCGELMPEIFEDLAVEEL